MKYYGHPEFYKIVERLKQLHSDKNFQYASKENPLGNFIRTSNLASKLLKDNINKPLAMAMAFMAKQIDAVYDIVGENKENTVENIEGKFEDIAVYSILCIILYRERNK